jgi:hypothetical protein
MPIGRPRQYDCTPHTARPAPSLPTRPFDWRGDDDKPALRYLTASGAGAISIIADVDGASIKVGFDPTDVETVETFWLPKDKARSIAARARHLAGDDPDVDGAVAAIRRAAAECRVTITLHATAIARAAEMSAALDLMGRGDACERTTQSLQPDVQGATCRRGRGRSRLYELSHGRSSPAQDADHVARVGRQRASRRDQARLHVNPRNRRPLIERAVRSAA